MRVAGNTVLITGGATGIGLALAEVFLREGNKVLICGRTESRLAEAKAELPRVNTIRCDISEEEDIKYLLERVQSDYPKTNILVNNAGIQRMIDFTAGPLQLLDGESEIDINLKAPIHLSAYFIPFLMQSKEAAIINVSSGLAFAPLAFMPVYCATKAAIHSFTLSLRHQLKGTSIKVFELIPPRVDTDLGKGSRGNWERTAAAIPAVQVAETAVEALKNDTYEVAVGAANDLMKGSRQNPEELFQLMNMS